MKDVQFSQHSEKGWAPRARTRELLTVVGRLIPPKTIYLYITQRVFIM